MTTMNKLEYINCDMLEDLGFTQIEYDFDGLIDMTFDSGYRHPALDAKGLILVNYNNGGWHFAQRKNALNGIGHMVWLDDLITGFEFVTGQKLLQ